MKNNKGFTLIELLATISVLSVILIIAMTMVVNMVEASRKEAYKLSVSGMLKSANLSFSKEYIEKNSNLKTAVFIFEDGIETSNIEGLKANFDGKKPKVGNMLVRSDGKTAASLHDGTYCATKVITGDAVIITNDSEEDCIEELYKPLILFPNGSTINHEVNTPFNPDYVRVYTIGRESTTGYTSTILFNGNPVGSVNTGLKGTYEITYTITEDGFTSTRTLTLIVRDTIPPVILGANDLTLTVNEALALNPLAGITVTDNSNDVISATYETYTVTGVGVFYITYRAVDTSGNQATPISRRLTVIDVTNPIVTFGTNGNAAFARTRNTTITASDADSGIVSGSLEYQWTTSTTAPTEASFVTPFTNGATITSPAGVTGAYYLWVIAKDQTGNTTITRSNVFNLDNTNPTIVIGTNGSATYVRTASTTLTASDANSGVSDRRYQWTTSTTAPTDASFITTFANGATITTPVGVTGTYYLWYRIVDVAGNILINRTNVFNLDNTPPVITLTGGSGTTALGTAYTEQGYTATDNISGTITANVVRTGTVNQNISGSYTLTYTVTDTAGNITSVNRSVTVNTRTEYRYRDLVESCSTCYDTCSSSYSATANYSCSSGWSLSGSTCSRTVTGTGSTTYTCPSGYSGGGASSSCTHTTTGTGSTTYTCPSGYSGGGASSSCTRSFSATGYYSCPSGGSLSGSTCTQTASYGPLHSCPSGYFDTGVDCRRTYTATWYYNSCGTGCSRSGATCNCTATGTGSTTYTCPSGYSGGGASSSCSRTVTGTGSTTYTCPSGYSGGGASSSCTSSQAASVSYSCPSGGSLSGSTCNTSYSCNPYSCNCSSYWDSWSTWSTTVRTASGTRQVETRVLTSI